MLEAAERERLSARRAARPRRRPAGAGGRRPAGAPRGARRAGRGADHARTRAGASPPGAIDGDIKGAECNPFPDTQERRAAEQDPALATGRYDCVAYTSRFEAPELDGQKRTGLFGYPYWLVVDYEDAELVWCKVTPRAGEGGRSLAAVPVPEPCRDPAGPG